jgi:ethanolamine permease
VTTQGQGQGGEYLEQRELRRGAAGWVLLAGLGVAYVISGDFAGWNFGLAEGGWGGMLIATILMGTMYTAMCFALAELSSAIPTTGGGYGFARRALGPLGGFMTGTAILIEYTLAPAAIAVFIAGYLDSLVGIGGIPVYIGCYVVFIAVHLYGVGEALRLVFAITVIAVVALLVFLVAMVGQFDAANLTNVGDGSFLPEGLGGVWAAFPFAIWFFLAVEGVPLAAEESEDPRRDLPRGLIAAILVLVVFAALVLTLAPGGGGAAEIADSDNPLVDALESPLAYDGETPVSQFVNAAGLAGLVASFFSIVYGYSRQTFALSRAGYLPTGLSVVSSRRVPALALLVPGAIGLALAILLEDGALLIDMAVFGATISYVLMMLSHIVLRRREPGLDRPYRTPGGVATSGLALVLAFAAVIATFIVDEQAALIMLAVYAAFIAYFLLYSRRKIVAQAPEEEFAAIQAAERDLAGS